MNAVNWFVGVAVFVAGAAITGIFFYVLMHQFALYEKLWSFTAIQENPIAALAVARAFEFSSAKYISIFLSFIMITSGSLYIIIAATTLFNATIDVKDKMQGSVNATSPGIIVVFLGALLAALSIYNKTELTAVGEIKPIEVKSDDQFVPLNR